MENIFFLALLAVVGLVRWLSAMAEAKKNREAEKRAQDPAPNAPIPRAPATTEEERIRRFMEALGMPSSAPIPKATPPQTAPEAPAPKRKIQPIDPFPLPRAGRLPPPLPVPSPPPVIISTEPAPAAEPPLLPTRQTTVPAAPAHARASSTRRPAEFDVWDIDEVTAEDAPASGGGARSGDRPTTQQTSLATRLATRDALRDAIVLREIFGPPRSMQPVEFGRPS